MKMKGLKNFHVISGTDKKKILFKIDSLYCKKFDKKTRKIKLSHEISLNE